MKQNRAFLYTGVIITVLVIIASAAFTSFYGLRRPRRVIAATAEPALSTARGMCTIEMNSGRVLYSKDMDKQMPMASTTKIVTAICLCCTIWL